MSYKEAFYKRHAHRLELMSIRPSDDYMEMLADQCVVHLANNLSRESIEAFSTKAHTARFIKRIHSSLEKMTVHLVESGNHCSGGRSGGRSAGCEHWLPRGFCAKRPGRWCSLMLCPTGLLISRHPVLSEIFDKGVPPWRRGPDERPVT